jgi:hypothetical protein
MSTIDYIPRQDGKFLEWVKFLFAYVQEHTMNWNINPSALNDITPLLEKFETDYAKAENPNRGKADVTAKNESRDTLQAAVRHYVKEFLAYNSLVTDEDRRHMALPVHDKKPTPSPGVLAMPEGEVDFSKHQMHRLFVKSPTGKAKPTHAHGFEAWRKVGGDAPATDSEWAYANFTSRSPLQLDYPLADVGKTVYYRFRWVNTRNQPGPWSDTINAVIA